MPAKPRSSRGYSSDLGKQLTGVREGLTGFGNAIGGMKMPKIGKAKKQVGRKIKRK